MNDLLGSRGEANFVWKCKNCKVSPARLLVILELTQVSENRPQPSKLLRTRTHRAHLRKPRTLSRWIVEDWSSPSFISEANGSPREKRARRHLRSISRTGQRKGDGMIMMKRPVRRWVSASARRRLAGCERVSRDVKGRLARNDGRYEFVAALQPGTRSS